MFSDFSRDERTFSFIILGGLVVAGLAMAIAGRGDLLGTHGWLIFGLSLIVFFAAVRHFDRSRDDPRRHQLDSP